MVVVEGACKFMEPRLRSSVSHAAKPLRLHVVSGMGQPFQQPPSMFSLFCLLFIASMSVFSLSMYNFYLDYLFTFTFSSFIPLFIFYDTLSLLSSLAFHFSAAVEVWPVDFVYRCMWQVGSGSPLVLSLFAGVSTHTHTHANTITTLLIHTTI